MKVRITFVVDLGEPEMWRRWSQQGARRRRILDRRPLSEILEERLSEAEWGIDEYLSGQTIESQIEELP